MKQDVKKVLKISVISLFFLIIILYAFFRSKDLIFGVKIKNVNIDGAPLYSGETFSNQIINISGNARNAIYLSLDDREISIDQAGDFNESLALLSGYNIITIKAKDKFGHIDEKDYKLIYKDSVTP